MDVLEFGKGQIRSYRANFHNFSLSNSAPTAQRTEHQSSSRMFENGRAPCRGPNKQPVLINRASISLLTSIEQLTPGHNSFPHLTSSPSIDTEEAMAGKKGASKRANALKKQNQQSVKEEKERIALAEEHELKLAEDRKVQQYSKNLSKRTPAVALDGCPAEESSLAIMHGQEEGQEEGLDLEGQAEGDNEVLPQVEAINAEMGVHEPMEVDNEVLPQVEPINAEMGVHEPVEVDNEVLPQVEAINADMGVHEPVEGVGEARDADEPMEAENEEMVVHAPDALVFAVIDDGVLQEP